MTGLPKNFIKIYNIRGLDTVFEVKYPWNGRVKKDEVNTNVVEYDWPNVQYPHWFCL